MFLRVFYTPEAYGKFWEDYGIVPPDEICLYPERWKKEIREKFIQIVGGWVTFGICPIFLQLIRNYWKPTNGVYYGQNGNKKLLNCIIAIFSKKRQ